MIYLEDGSVVPVEKSELPIELPDDVDLKTKGHPLDIHQIGKIQHKSTGEKAQERRIPQTHSLTLLGIFEILFSKDDKSPFNEVNIGCQLINILAV